jgi:hypothetical protein
MLTQLARTRLSPGSWSVCQEGGQKQEKVFEDKGEKRGESREHSLRIYESCFLTKIRDIGKILVPRARENKAH